MAGFNAGKIVEPLDYDLSAFGGPAGTITEPTDDQIEAFGHALISWQREVRSWRDDLPEDATADQVYEALEGIPPERGLEVVQQQAQIYAAVCSGQPSVPDIMKLPRRIRQHFYQWLDKELTSPEAVAGGGNGQVLNLPSRAAG